MSGAAWPRTSLSVDLLGAIGAIRIDTPTGPLHQGVTTAARDWSRDRPARPDRHDFITPSGWWRIERSPSSWSATFYRYQTPQLRPPPSIERL